MNSKNILIGEVRKCTNHNSEIYKKDAVLVSVGYHRYIEIENLNPLLQLFLFIDRLTHPKISSNLVEYPYCMTMDSSPSSNGELFVNEKTLEQYYEGDKNISVQTLRRELGKK